jgi:hypothetical protein
MEFNQQYIGLDKKRNTGRHKKTIPAGIRNTGRHKNYVFGTVWLIIASFIVLSPSA